jgi:murein DD-endopeptidase MepM/ murein hydrolase activator NlpD
VILDNQSVNLTNPFRLGLNCGLAGAALYLVLCLLFASSIADAQTNPAGQKKTSPQKGIQINQNQSSKQVNQGSGLQSQSIQEPISSLTDPGTEEYSQFDAVPDFQIVRGCARRGFRESNLPSRIGITDPEFLEYFKNHTGRFFDSISGSCIPYVVAFGKRGRFEALSIMNRLDRDEKSQILTFTPSAFGGFLVQEENLADQMEFWTELFIPLYEVLYDPQRLGDKLPVELAWELNSIVKQLYPDDTASLENTPKQVRIIVDFGTRDRWAQIWAIEVINPQTNQVLADAFWLDRSDIPGSFFTANGESIERSFWTNPLSYRRISRGVGQVPIRSRTNPNHPQAQSKDRRYRTHMGIDYAAPTGTPVFSVANGKVAFKGFSGAYGRLIIIDHPGHYRTYYAHLSNYNSELVVGNEIRRGMEIGYVGSTGRSTGPHLHYELRKNGIYVDPYNQKIQLDLWTMRPSDSGQFTKQLLLLGSILRE